MHQRYLTFRGRVHTVYGPVDAWEQELDQRHPEQLPPSAVTLKCAELTVSEDPDAQLRDWGIQFGEEATERFSVADCVPMQTDSVYHTVEWSHGGDLAGLSQRLIAIRFHLRDAVSVQLLD